MRTPWSASDHSCTESARPGRDSAPGRRAASACASRCSSAIALLIFGFLVLTVIDQWSEIQDKGVHFHVLWLIPAFVILPLFYALSALGWDLTLRFLGYRIGVGRAQVAWGQPMLARYVPGSVLYVLGRVLLSERAGVPRRLTVASIVYEQAITATSAIVFSAYFFITHPDLQGQPLRWAFLLLIPLAIGVLHPKVFGPLADRVLRAFGREPLPGVISMQQVLALLVYYLVVWAVISVGIYCVARSVSSVSPSDIFTVGSAQALGYVAALATLIAPAGLGVRDAVFAWAIKGAVPGRELRRRLADRDRGARRPDRGRSPLRRRRHRDRQAAGLEHPHRGLPRLAGGGGRRRGRGPGGRRGGARSLELPVTGMRIRWSALLKGGGVAAGGAAGAAAPAGAARARAAAAARRRRRPAPRGAARRPPAAAARRPRIGVSAARPLGRPAAAARRHQARRRRQRAPPPGGPRSPAASPAASPRPRRPPRRRRRRPLPAPAPYRAAAGARRRLDRVRAALTSGPPRCA